VMEEFAVMIVPSEGLGDVKEQAGCSGS